MDDGRVNNFDGDYADQDQDEYLPEISGCDEDDETTMAEQEQIESQEDIMEELAGLEEDQDIPVEKLLELYGYGSSNGNLGAHSSEVSSSSSSDGELFASGKKKKFIIDADGHVNSVDDYSNGSGPEGPQSSLDSKHGYFSDVDDDSGEERVRQDDEDSEDDVDYIPIEPWKKEIKVGPSFQADIPDLLDQQPCYSGTIPDKEDLEDRCVWNPSSIDEPAVEEYLRKVLGPKEDVIQPPVTTTSPVRDDEQALSILLNCKFDVSQALKLHIEEAEGLPSALWSEEDTQAFEDGVAAYGKNFRRIKEDHLPSKSVRELVEFYYFWKKTERHDVFVEKIRLEKRQYILHPYTTDYLEHFLSVLHHHHDASWSVHAASSDQTTSQFETAYPASSQNGQSSGSDTQTPPTVAFPNGLIGLLPSPSKSSQISPPDESDTAKHESSKFWREDEVLASDAPTPPLAISSEGAASG